MSNLKAIAEKQQEAIRKIWLAGIGFYARGFEEFSSVSSKGRNFFNELTVKGEQFEKEAKARITETSEQTREKVESQVARITTTSAGRFDEINGKLDKLTAAVEEKPARKVAAKK